jgi:VanZ family protein
MVLVTLYLSITTTLPEQYDGPRFEGMDKLTHFFLYLVLVLAITKDFYKQWVDFSSLKMKLWAVVLPILYGGAIELLQQNFFPPRTAEWSDWIADVLGVLAGYFLAKSIYPKYIKRESNSFQCKN